MQISNKNFAAIPALTGLRFFAALMVFFSHYPIISSNNTLNLLQVSGYNGVTFFFVLSGFIIAYNYLDRFEFNTLRSTPRYLLARFSRVYPLYALLIIFSWMNSGGAISIWPYLTATQAWGPDLSISMGLNSPSWSISVEAFLYLLFPLLIPLIKKLGALKSQRMLILLIAAVISCQIALALYFSMPERAALGAISPDSAHRWLYRNPGTRSLDFLLGIFSAIYYRRFFVQTDFNTKIWSTVTYASIACILVFACSPTIGSTAFAWDAAYAVPYTLMILSIAIASKTMVAKFLARPRVVFLGEASYAFYLIHILLGSMYIMQKSSSLPYILLHHMLFLGITTCVAVGLHIGVEKPAQQLLRNLFKTKSAKPTPNEAALTSQAGNARTEANQKV